jgi:hypothetical protein
MQCARIAWSGSVNSARSWAGIFGTAIFGFIQYLAGREVIFAHDTPGAIAYTIACTAALWAVIFGYKLFRAPGIARRRNKPLRILLGAELYELVENENIIDQSVCVQLKNISDVRIRHCIFRIIDAKPIIANMPIFIRGDISLDPGEYENIQIAYFKKGKTPPTRWFGICIPLAPVIGGNMLTIPEGAYDITIEASCDEVEESQISCHLWISEDDTLRLDAR